MTSFELDFRSFPDADGCIAYALVPWDSEEFGFPVYELRIAEPSSFTTDVVRSWLHQLDSAGGCLVSAKVDQQSVSTIRSLASNGFYPVETVLEVEGELPTIGAVAITSAIPVRLRRATEADMDAMTSIAARAFWSDRFHLDPNLPSNAADERYVRWIRRAFQDQELLYAYERTDERAVIGFYHVRVVSRGRVDLMLAAVDPALSGRGLGSALYLSMMRECVGLGFTEARTRIVARNLPVLNIFSRLRFRFVGATTTLHWCSPETAAVSQEV